MKKNTKENSTNWKAITQCVHLKFPIWSNKISKILAGWIQSCNTDKRFMKKSLAREK